MEKNFKDFVQGYQTFRQKYALGDRSVMHHLSLNGQNPKIMVVACCDSRVDPGLILQCEPGELFVVRNVANIVPPFEKDDAHHGTSAALEFGIRFLGVNDLIILGHSQCGGIQALFDQNTPQQNDFISNWVALIEPPIGEKCHQDDYAKHALIQSYNNCLTFPWIKEKINTQQLTIHLWFFDIKTGQIFAYCETRKQYFLLD